MEVEVIHTDFTGRRVSAANCLGVNDRVVVMRYICR